MQILLQITQQNNELKTRTRRNGTRRREGAVPSTLELNGRARQSLNLNRRPLTKLRDFSVTEFRGSSRRFERDNVGSGDGSHERFSAKRNNPRQEGSQKWSFVVMALRDASLLAPFYTSQPKKKKKTVFTLENPETVLEWRCERSSCDLLCDANELLGCLCALLYTYFCLGGQYQACFFIYLPCTQWTL